MLANHYKRQVRSLQMACLQYEWLAIAYEYVAKMLSLRILGHVSNIRKTSKSSANAYESLRMLGDHAAIMANWWRIAFVSPFLRYSLRCKSSIRKAYSQHIINHSQAIFIVWKAFVVVVRRL